MHDTGWIFLRIFIEIPDYLWEKNCYIKHCTEVHFSDCPSVQLCNAKKAAYEINKASHII
jgi:hypothetical protein